MALAEPVAARLGSPRSALAGAGAPPPRLALRATLLSSIRDLRWRGRRFLLATLAIGLALGVALIMTGISNGFSLEIRDTMAALGANSWLVPPGSPGPFSDPTPFPLAKVSEVAARPGMGDAAPLLVWRALERAPAGAGGSAGPERDVNLLGVLPGHLGSPAVSSGRPLGAPGGVVVDSALGVGVGGVVALDGRRFRVVGLVDGDSYFAGEPDVFIDIHTLDAMLNGLPVASAVLVAAPGRGAPGFSSLGDAAVRADLARPVAQGNQALKFVAVLLWIVATGIIAAIVTLSAIERRADFAVLKAVGAPSASIFLGLVVQSVAIALGGAVVAYAVKVVASPYAGLSVRASLLDYLAVPVLAIVVGAVASLLPARWAARVDPATALAGRP